MTGIRVVLVDHQYLVRTGLRALLERAPDIAVVGEAGDGATPRWASSARSGPTSC